MQKKVPGSFILSGTFTEPPGGTAATKPQTGPLALKFDVPVRDTNSELRKHNVMSEDNRVGGKGTEGGAGRAQRDLIEWPGKAHSGGSERRGVRVAEVGREHTGPEMGCPGTDREQRAAVAGAQEVA